MDSIAAAQQLRFVGKFREALQTMSPGEARRDPAPTLLLRAELLAFVGECAKAQKLVESLRGQKSLSDRDRSHLEFISSWIAVECGSTEDELQHLQRSIFYADRSG